MLYQALSMAPRQLMQHLLSHRYRRHHHHGYHLHLLNNLDPRQFACGPACLQQGNGLDSFIHPTLNQIQLMRQPRSTRLPRSAASGATAAACAAATVMPPSLHHIEEPFMLQWLPALWSRAHCQGHQHSGQEGHASWVEF